MDILEILDQARYPKPLTNEECEISLAASRVLAEDVYVQRNMPAFRESTRDGFALASPANKQIYKLRLEEAYAGNTAIISLKDGEACPIMTGGLIPDNCFKVIPYEHAQIEDHKLIVKSLSLPDFIRPIGATCKKGDLLYHKGTILRAEHLSLLASTGNSTVSVYRKPRLAFIATGQELCTSDTIPPHGKKTATNCYVIKEMCAKYCAEFHDLGLIKDSRKDIKNILQEQGGKYDIIVSTGGMGPGKYDFLEDCFVAVGGKVITTELPMVPGKSTLVGWLKDSLFYGLPGTPTAVRPLFTILIARSLVAMQGLSEESFPDFKGKMIEKYLLRVSAIPSLWPARTIIKDSQIRLKGIGKNEYPDGYIFIEAGKDHLSINEEYHFFSLNSPFG
ncbi:MAG: molybdopterin molybdotransferase MoeA [Desulfotalea sp.]